MTRNVTMTVRKPDGSLWAGAEVTFDLLTKLTVTGSSSVFQSQVSVTTNASGQATAVLETPPVGDGAWLWRCTPPDGNWFDFALEYGASALDLSTIIAAISLANIAPSAVAALLAAYLPLSGGTLTGKLTLDGDPTNDLHAATKQYVDDNGGGGVSDHGDLTGLADDDHTQYAKKASNLSDLASAATARTNLGLAIGTDVQGYSAKTAALAALTWAANSIIWLTGTATASVQALASHIVALLQSATAADARSAIGAGTGDLLASNNLSELAATASTARTNLGLGTIATQAANSVNLTGGSISGVTTLSVTGSANATVGMALNSIGFVGYSGNQVRWGLSASWFQHAWYTDATQKMMLDINGQLGIGLSLSPSAHLHTLESDAATNSVVEHVIHGLRSTGTAAAGFGLSVKRQLESSTTNDVDVSRNVTLWNVATHASRTVDVVQYATDYGAEREIWRGRANGTAPAIAFLGATPVVRASHIADPSGGGTQDAEGRTAINAILVVLENLGLVATS